MVLIKELLTLLLAVPDLMKMDVGHIDFLECFYICPVLQIPTCKNHNSFPHSLSSPLSLSVVVLYLQGVGTKEWREFGRTEVIDNTRNPDFVRKFVLDFFFEEKQNLRFDV
ncbi:Copine-8 [Nibea albiflora]|uniref:Copine-8 n=1 Tax=Nibea albiflora TaxID=240163 RepID=A0ACB7ELW7_NIBAL|nr:Copine-8 [Nibea albiflora]